MPRAVVIFTILLVSSLVINVYLFMENRNNNGLLTDCQERLVANPPMNLDVETLNIQFEGAKGIVVDQQLLLDQLKHAVTNEQLEEYQRIAQELQNTMLELMKNIDGTNKAILNSIR